MKLKFLGATETVTGSKYLLTLNGENILIDCGLFQGLKALRLRNWEDIPTDISQLKAVILTHAHIDHSGYLPRLVKMGFKGKIYCTTATRELCKILLPDSARLMEEEAYYANKKGYSKHKPAFPLFNEEDAQRTLRNFRIVGRGKELELKKDTFIQFFNSGHILGSGHVLVKSNDKKILFSGDIGRRFDPILRPPKVPPEVDYLVIESTYGNRLHESSDLLNDLGDIILKTYKRGGTILIPAFAVGRSQEILYYIHQLKKEKKIPDIPVYLNSPMAQEVTDLYLKLSSNQKLSKNELLTILRDAIYVGSVEESKKLNRNKEPKIIISASGMATGGRVLHHIKHFGVDEKSTLLFVGFQAQGTRGARILQGEESVKIHGAFYPIKASVFQINGLSAHADRSELLDWAKKIKTAPRKVFITHGELESAQGLKKLLEEELKWDCVIPSFLQEFDLS